MHSDVLNIFGHQGNVFEVMQQQQQQPVEARLDGPVVDLEIIDESQDQIVSSNGMTTRLSPDSKEDSEENVDSDVNTDPKVDVDVEKGET